jgi:hypothetical protein
MINNVHFILQTLDRYGKGCGIRRGHGIKSTSMLQRGLVKWIQEKTPIGLMATNVAHRIAKAIYHGEAWLEIYEIWYDGTQKTTKHLLKTLHPSW